MNIKNKKGFTLIELMIVIAIIGVLAVTLVPQLTGAQSKARDTGRISSISSLKTVIETFFSDNGVFPDPIASTSCLSSDSNGTVNSSTTVDGTTVSEFSNYFSKGFASTDPNKTAVVMGCTTGGSFGYKKVEADGVTNAAYIIAADVESDVRANAVNATAVSATTFTAAQKVLTDKVGTAKGKEAIYIEIGR